MSIALRSLALLAALTAAPTAQDVLVVHPVNGPFTTVQDAVDAAAPGDVVWIDAYVTTFDLEIDKGLSLVSAFGGAARFERGIHVRGVPAGQTVVISGVDAYGETSSADHSLGYGLEITNCAGDVRVQDSQFFGADGDPDGWDADFSAFEFTITGHVAGWAGIRAIDNDGSVTFTNVTSQGGDATSTDSWDPQVSDSCGCTYGVSGGHGAAIIRTEAGFDGCTLTGGRGGAGDHAGGRGGDGLRLIDDGAFVAGSTLQGADGGFQADAISFGPGGDGGDGVWMGATPDVVVLESALAGGSEGGGWGFPGQDGAPFGGSGSVDVSPDTRRALTVSPYALDDASVDLSIEGSFGDMVVLYVSPGGASFVPSPKFAGAFSVAFPALSIPLGTIPTLGELALTAPLPPLAPIEGVTLHLQAVAGSGDDVTLTGHRTLTIVDASIP